MSHLLKLRLTMDVVYDLDSEDMRDDDENEITPHGLACRRNAVVNHLASLPEFISGEGFLTGDDPVVVESWEHKIETL